MASRKGAARGGPPVVEDDDIDMDSLADDIDVDASTSDRCEKLDADGLQCQKGTELHDAHVFGPEEPEDV